MNRIAWWTYWLVRGWWSGVKFRLGYWVRPYDDVLDARRWRWQERGRCGFRTYSELSPEHRQAIVAAALRAQRRRQERS